MKQGLKEKIVYKASTTILLILMSSKLAFSLDYTKSHFVFDEHNTRDSACLERGDNLVRQLKNQTATVAVNSVVRSQRNHAGFPQEWRFVSIHIPSVYDGGLTNFNIVCHYNMLVMRRSHLTFGYPNYHRTILGSYVEEKDSVGTLISIDMQISNDGEKRFYDHILSTYRSMYGNDHVQPDNLN